MERISPLGSRVPSARQCQQYDPHKVWRELGQGHDTKSMSLVFRGWFHFDEAVAWGIPGLNILTAANPQCQRQRCQACTHSTQYQRQRCRACKHSTQTQSSQNLKFSPGSQHVAVQSPLLSLVGASTARSVKACAKHVKVPEIIDRETELKPRQLSDYFGRIDLPSHLQNERRLGRLDSELLRAIVKGHITHIPFENLSLVIPSTRHPTSNHRCRKPGWCQLT